jgi:hypothetical protein
MELKHNFDALDAEMNPLIVKGKTTAELVKIDESIKIINKQVKRLKTYVQNRSVLNTGNNESKYPSYPFY